MQSVPAKLLRVEAGADLLLIFIVELIPHLGEEVETLVDGFYSAGTYSIQFEAADLPSGIYYYRLYTGNYSNTKKIVLLK